MRRYGTLLAIDETHSISSTGPGGYTRAHGLEPDLFVTRQADGRRLSLRRIRLHRAVDWRMRAQQAKRDAPHGH
jgi:glutamate-1-semialdehyde 2,1-aminomutase